ncbi:Metallophosphoesterase domain-containing protein 1 (Adult brain protein 239) (239AB) [Durusdinium trenchii]|uniref:Metallophosphoesterase domain-containing protein 1 (Adult brain protein 239) (239AB) n=1 Tax=Durusdinium trenchii TaxID=1381693 RepID=A0ABP0SD70_9DINO
MSMLLALALLFTQSATEAADNHTNTSSTAQGPTIGPSTGLKVRRTQQVVTILHVSDTHSLHRSTGDLPAADIFIHSGDVAKVGNDAELGDFNDWLGQIKDKYQHMFIIAGNHDFWDTNWRLNRGWMSQAEAQSPEYFQSKITNAKVLNHELVEVMGLKIWGAGWHARRGDSRSGNAYDDVPAGVDVLVTHDGPFGIFDMTGGGHWGSSHELLGAIYRAKPKVHLFGHIHEQRGHWDRSGSTFQGGVEYRPNPAITHVFRPNGPPAANYPVEVESNNAMANQPTVDHSWTGVWAPQHVVGRARLIVGKHDGNAWHFSSSVP